MCSSGTMRMRRVAGSHATAIEMRRVSSLRNTVRGLTDAESSGTENSAHAGEESEIRSAYGTGKTETIGDGGTTIGAVGGGVVFRAQPQETNATASAAMAMARHGRADLVRNEGTSATDTGRWPPSKMGGATDGGPREV